MARWLSTDALEASYVGLSPYNFVKNNPVMFIDPDGNRVVLAKQADANHFASDINAMAGGGFRFNKSGELRLKFFSRFKFRKKGNYSKDYRKNLIRAIRADRVVTLNKVSSDFKHPWKTVAGDGTSLVGRTDDDGEPVTINQTLSDFGGGKTQGFYGSDAEVYVDGTGFSDDVGDEKGKAIGETFERSSARILMHEFLAHVFPAIFDETYNRSGDQNEHDAIQGTDFPLNEVNPEHSESFENPVTGSNGQSVKKKEHE